MAKPTIVLVDGDDEYRGSLAEALQSSGYRIRPCREAQEAWENVAAREPTMIISEVELPDAQGMMLLRTYRRAFPQRQTPFVFLSHRHEPARIVRSLEAGADDHWSKVHPIDEVAARVATTLRRGRSFARRWRRDGTRVSPQR
jgi:DNA-binding response OmpR family regulator